MAELGFILTRHVISKDTNLYWVECCRCIRTFYPTAPIVILDDGSDPAYVSGNLPSNTSVVPATHLKRGELNPYLFMKQHRPFAKAVILHDSVFLTAPLPVDSVTNVKFLWHFNPDANSVETTNHLIRMIPAETSALDKLYRSVNWKGCFGVQSVITLDFVDTLPLELLVDHIQCRSDRQGLERLFALLCCLRVPDLVSSSSLFGSIYEQPKEWGYTFANYVREAGNHPSGPPVKVWTGR